MADLDGSESLEIHAPVERCFEVAADVERAPEWQGTMKTATVHERDADGRAKVVETVADAKVSQVKVKLRFSYDEPRGLSWERIGGDLKALHGSWSFEDLGGRTRATYSLTADPGRMLGMLLRGPAEAKVRDFLLGGAAEGLKRRAEGGG